MRGKWTGKGRGGGRGGGRSRWGREKGEEGVGFYLSLSFGVMRQQTAKIYQENCESVIVCCCKFFSYFCFGWISVMFSWARGFCSPGWIAGLILSCVLLLSFGDWLVLLVPGVLLPIHRELEILRASFYVRTLGPDAVNKL